MILAIRVDVEQYFCMVLAPHCLIKAKVLGVMEERQFTTVSISSSRNSLGCISRVPIAGAIKAKTFTRCPALLLLRFNPISHFTLFLYPISTAGCNPVEHYHYSSPLHHGPAGNIRISTEL
jgi:hypothetical protein